jgi:hypothetical protein
MCLALLLCLAARAEAAKFLMFEAQIPIGISPWPGGYSEGKLCSFWIEAGYVGDLDPARETARVSVSGGSLVEGDSVVTIGPGAQARWHIVVRRAGDDPLRVWSSVLIETKHPGTYDFFERMLEVRFQHLRDDLDTVLIVNQRPGRSIAGRDGKRYRYGGAYFVAIGDDEREPPESYERRAEVLSRDDIPCSDCGLKDALEVPVVVTVGATGKATWPRITRRYGMAEPAPPTSVDPKVWNAIERGLKMFRYRSAMSDGHPVADYVTLTVRVVP